MVDDLQRVKYWRGVRERDLGVFGEGVFEQVTLKSISGPLRENPSEINTKVEGKNIPGRENFQALRMSLYISKHKDLT